MPDDTPPPRPRLHRDVWTLGLVSFLTDLSSEMIFAVFAVVFTTVAGASSRLLGLIEGLADLSASSLNLLSGRWSDRAGRRQPFALAGYGFSAAAKLLLLGGATVAGLAAFRVIERLGKGFRGPPRDAWLARIGGRATRGTAFGVHKALDKAGAVAGPLLAWALLGAWGESAQSYQRLFLVALLPALAGVAVLALLRDPPAAAAPTSAEAPPSWRSVLSPALRRFLWPAGVFALAYYSLGFLLLRAHEAGFSVRQVVLLYALFNASCVLTAPLVGALGDRIGRQPVVALGYGLYGLINAGLLLQPGPAGLVALFVLYGVFYAVEDSQSKAFIADLVPAQRATAIGLYNALTGVLYLGASLLAGALWAWAPAAVFGLAAALSAMAIALLLTMRPQAAADMASSRPRQ